MIAILREVAAEFRNPVLMYSIGKDSSVLLHLARKAFYPAKPPFPLLHIDTTWKFREMIAFRDATARALGLDLIVHTNQEGLARGINPIASGSALHTEIMKTEALKQALDKYGFDAAIGGARRDEEKSRAKERVFSLPRPRPWLGAAAAASGTLDPVQYPARARRDDAGLPAVELDRTRCVGLHRGRADPGRAAVFRQERGRLSSATASGSWSMTIGCRCVRARRRELRMVRFRTLGCYPLTGAVESEALTVADIVGRTAPGAHARSGRGG